MKKLGIPLLVVTIVLSAFLLKGKIPHEKFDLYVWKIANPNLEENMSLRWDMLNDLRTEYKLVGMSKKEIITLLGKPETEMTSQFIYYLGYTKKGINTGSLTITFNEKDIVTDMQVWQG